MHASRFFRSFRLGSLLLPLALAGCQVTPGQKVALVDANGNVLAIATVGGGGGSCPSAGGVTPASAPPASQAPPAADGAGSAPPQSPAPQLPAPQASSQSAQQLGAQYGIQIFGPAVNPTNLGRLEFALQQYDKQRHLNGLRSVELTYSAGDGVLGVWSGPSSRMTGSPIPPSGRIRLFAGNAGGEYRISTHAAVHEVGHHVCESSRGFDFGRGFDQALGAGTPAHPSTYSRAGAPEKLAENVSFMLIGSQYSPNRSLPTWNPSPSAQQLFSQEFARAPQLR